MLSQTMYTALGLAPLIAGARAAVPARFFSESGGIQKAALLDPIALPFDVPASQTSNFFSYWTSSFITGMDDHEYLVLSHTLTNVGMYRASIIDIADPTSFRTFSVTNSPNLTTKNGTMYMDYGEFGFANTSPDPLGTFRTWSARSDVNYNITVEMSTPLLLNAGNGRFNQVPAANITTDPRTTEEWSMPAGHTSGSIVAPGGQSVEIDPSRSFTWYDRQWGNAGCDTSSGTPSNWTWFELTLGSEAGTAGTKYSIWFFPYGETNTVKSVATVRYAAGEQTLVPATFIESGPYWTSPNTNVTYPLSWTVSLANGLTMNITSVAEDQELWSEDQTNIAFEGFVDVKATRKNGEIIDGFGLVEVKPVEQTA